MIRWYVAWSGLIWVCINGRFKIHRKNYSNIQANHHFTGPCRTWRITGLTWTHVTMHQLSFTSGAIRCCHAAPLLLQQLNLVCHRALHLITNDSAFTRQLEALCHKLRLNSLPTIRTNHVHLENAGVTGSLCRCSSQSTNCYSCHRWPWAGTLSGVMGHRNLM